MVNREGGAEGRKAKAANNYGTEGGGPHKGGDKGVEVDAAGSSLCLQIPHGGGKESAGYDGRHKAYAHGLPHEGATYEAPTGSDELHGVYAVTTGVDAHAHGVVDE